MEKINRIVRATMLAGFVPGLVVPIVWPVVVFLVEGRWPTWSSYPMAALAVSFFAICLALPSSIVLGAPALLGLERLEVNTPVVAATAGALIAMLLYALASFAGSYPPLVEAWPLAALFAFVGALCGGIAGLLSRTDKSLKTGTAQSAAP